MLQLIVDFFDSHAIIALNSPARGDHGACPTGRLTQPGGRETMNNFDPLYKRLYLHAPLVEDTLRAVLSMFPKLLKLIDFTTLRQVPAEVVTEALHRRYSDCVWEVGCRDSDQVFLILLEFQSTVVQDMALRMLEYSALQIRAYTAKAGSRCPCPYVIPLVLYNRKKPWTAKLTVGEMYAKEMESDVEEMESDVKELSPSQRYVLVNETERMGPLPKERSLFMALQAIIHGDSPDEVAAAFAAIDGWLNDDSYRELKRAMMDLFFSMTELKINEGDMIPEGMKMGELVNVLAENQQRWIVRWKEEGRQEGIEEGRQEGRQENLQENLQILLAQKFGSLPEDAIRRIQAAENGQLEQWLVRIFEASSLNDIFSD
jgi:predicted transposase YdaD